MDSSYFGFIPTFTLILGLIVGRFYAVFIACLCCVYGKFCAMFVACFVASIRRVLWLVKRAVVGTVSSQNGMYWRSHRLSSTLLRAVWHNCVETSRYCMAGLRNFSPQIRYCIGFASIA